MKLLTTWVCTWNHSLHGIVHLVSYSLHGIVHGITHYMELYMESLTTWNCTFSLLLITRYIKSLTTSEHLRNIFATSSEMFITHSLFTWFLGSLLGRV